MNLNDKALLLPKVLATLSAKPNNCETLSNLCKELEDYVYSKHPNTEPDDARKAIKQILDIGHSLGVLSVSSDEVKMAIKIDNYEKQTTPVQSDDDVSPNESLVDLTDDRPIKSSRSRRESAVMCMKLSAENIALTEDDLDYIFNDRRRLSGPSQSRRSASRNMRLRKRPY